jgi:hypothetical protein
MSLVNDALRRARDDQDRAQQPVRTAVLPVPIEPPRGQKPSATPWLLGVSVGLIAAAGWFLWQARRPAAPSTLAATSPRTGGQVQQLSMPVVAAAPEVTPPTNSQPPAQPTAAPAPAPPIGGAAAEAVLTAPTAEQATPDPALAANVVPALSPPSPLPAGGQPNPAPLPSQEPPPAAVASNSAPANPPPASPGEVTPPPPAIEAPKLPFPELRVQGIYYRKKNPAVLVGGRTLFLGDKIEGVTVIRIEPQSVTFEFSGQTNTVTL